MVDASRTPPTFEDAAIRSGLVSAAKLRGRSSWRAHATPKRSPMCWSKAAS